MPLATKPPEQFVVHDNCRFREPTRLIAPIRAQSIRILSQGVDCRGRLFCSLGDGVQAGSIRVLRNKRLSCDLLISGAAVRKKSEDDSGHKLKPHRVQQPSAIELPLRFGLESMPAEDAKRLQR